MKTIFVTGATGFIGSHIVKRLLKKKDTHIRILVRKTSDISAFREYIAEKRIKCIYGSLSERQILMEAVRDCDMIYHTAACVDVASSKYDTLIATNVVGTQNVVDAAVRNKVGRFLFVSSIGAIRRSTHEKVIANEDYVYTWCSTDIKTYQYSKYLAEKHVISACNGGLNGFIVNPSIVVGRGAHNKALVNVFKIGSFPLLPITQGGINFIHVDDVVSGIEAVLGKGKPGKRYILGGDNVTYEELFTHIASLYNKNPIHVTIPTLFRFCVPPFKKMYRYSYWSSRRAQSELEWKAARGWRDSIAETFTELRKLKLI